MWSHLTNSDNTKTILKSSSHKYALSGSETNKPDAKLIEVASRPHAADFITNAGCLLYCFKTIVFNFDDSY